MSKIKLLSLGSDPEFLIIDRSTGKYVSSMGIIPGDKDNPKELSDLGEGYSIQKDNVLAEFCVPPSADPEELYNSIIKAIEYVNEHILPENLELVAVTGALFEEKLLNNKYARTFGCSPSYNAWDLSVSTPENTVSNYRGAGFHIHIGYEDFDIEKSIALIQAMDLFIGVPSVLFDQDKVRRNQYGKAGEFRPTAFGCEYRVLGGYVMSNKAFYDAAMEGLLQAVDFVNQEREFTDEQALKIQLTINTNNTDLANELVSEFNLDELVYQV